MCYQQIKYLPINDIVEYECKLCMNFWKCFLITMQFSHRLSSAQTVEWNIMYAQAETQCGALNWLCNNTELRGSQFLPTESLVGKLWRMLRNTPTIRIVYTSTYCIEFMHTVYPSMFTTICSLHVQCTLLYLHNIPLRYPIIKLFTDTINYMEDNKFNYPMDIYNKKKFHHVSLVCGPCWIKLD